jgi:hypothetical protein
MNLQDGRMEEWNKRISDFRASGQSMKSWCEENKVTPRRMYYWMSKLNTKKVTGDSITWMPIAINEPAECGLKIQIGQAVITVKPGFDQRLLVDVIRVIKAIC